MLTRFAGWLNRRREDLAAAALRKEQANSAAALAKSAFAEAYPDRQVIPDWRRVDAVEDGHIVTLTHGSTTPPERSWWQVDAAGGVAEMPYDQAVRQIEIPLWR